MMCGLLMDRICYLGDDLVWAMGTLGFDDYVNPLKLYLTKYRQAAKADKSERPAGRSRTTGMDNSSHVVSM